MRYKTNWASGHLFGPSEERPRRGRHQADPGGRGRKRPTDARGRHGSAARAAQLRKAGLDRRAWPKRRGGRPVAGAVGSGAQAHLDGPRGQDPERTRNYAKKDPALSRN